MSDFEKKVVVGNLVIFPSVLRNYLTKSHYFVLYDPETEAFTLKVNDSVGGETIFEVRNVSYENAKKFAEDLGLRPSSNSSSPTSWSKWNPILRLHHDGSEDAEKIRMEMLRLGIPHRIIKNAKNLGLVNGVGIHQPPMWSVDKILEVIRETAELYKENLSTTP